MPISQLYKQFVDMSTPEQLEFFDAYVKERTEVLERAPVKKARGKRTAGPKAVTKKAIAKKAEKLALSEDQQDVLKKLGLM